MKVTRGDILSTIQARRSALEGRTSVPSARAAAHRLAQDEAVISALPEGTAEELKEQLKAESAALVRRKWTLAAAGLGMLVASGVNQYVEGNWMVSLGLGVAGMATTVVGGTTGDKASRADSRWAVVHHWQNHLQQAGQPTQSEPTTVFHNRLKSVSKEDLKCELLNVMSATREYLEQTRATDPAAASAIGRLAADERTIATLEGEKLDQIRDRLQTENVAHERLISTGKKVCFGLGGLALGLGVLDAVTPVPLKLPAIALTLVAVGAALKTGFTQDKVSANDYAASTIGRWEPLLESQKKIAGAPQEVKRLSEGSGPVEDIELTEDGLMVGDHFIEF